MNLNDKEIYRYLGYNSTIPDENTLILIDECKKLALENISPKCTYKKFDVNICNNDIYIENLHISSKDLAKNLENCSNIYLFGATLGVLADKLIEKYSYINMAKAVVLQAVLTEIIEVFCDEQCSIIENNLDNMYLKPRFSPGYGDFSIKHQIDFINILETHKKMGLTVTDSLILVPKKSVTAIIGVTNIKKNINKCKLCNKTNCEFRKV